METAAKKKTKMVTLELLSPARNYEAGKIALDNGADAVYIGAPRFGARQAASNDWEDVSKLAEYAHLFGARVYVVLNTIFFEEETGAMQQMLDEAGHCGADALIIQDPGILELRLPPLPIYMSTQADNVTVAKVKFWESLGCSRVILGRELSLDEITAIRRETSIELETFIHGALCVSYSGRCYLSEAIAQRSANRGACIQACRLPYKLIDGDGNIVGGEAKPWLCLKDLNASLRLEDLIKAGVTSFKIEGRLKDDVYAANTAAKYRLELDKIIAHSNGGFRRSSWGRSVLSYVPDLDKSFNRGYTDYNLNGRRADWLAAGPTSLGKKVGVIAGLRDDGFYFNSVSDLQTGDGVVFVRNETIIDGAFINQSGAVIKLNKNIDLKIGDLVYRNQDSTFEKMALRGARRELATNWEISFTDSDVTIRVKAENGAQAEMTIKGIWETAQDKVQASSNLSKQLGKLGNSIFYLNNLTVVGDIPFVPLSVLNAWRRELVDLLLVACRSAHHPGTPAAINNGSQSYPEKILDYRHNVANETSLRFYQRHGATVSEPAMEVSGETLDRALVTSKLCLRSVLGACPKEEGSRKLKEPLYLETRGRRFALKFDCKNCRMELYDFGDVTS